MSKLTRREVVAVGAASLMAPSAIGAEEPSAKIPFRLLVDSWIVNSHPQQVSFTLSLQAFRWNGFDRPSGPEWTINTVETFSGNDEGAEFLLGPGSGNGTPLHKDFDFDFGPAPAILHIIATLHFTGNNLKYFPMQESITPGDLARNCVRRRMDWVLGKEPNRYTGQLSFVLFPRLTF